MLVLSRKPEESIVINKNIIIKIIDIRGNRVRLGIEAPKDISVHRTEIFKLINAKGSFNNLDEDINAKI